MKLTDEELSILKNKEFLILKNSVSEKVISYLAEIERALHAQVKSSAFAFPDGTFIKAGKIAKGEQYQSLPYFILDYPRLFSQKEIFAFRSMLWWGNHYSCTLHLQGSFLKQHQEKLVHNLAQANDLYFCVNDQPWDYHYEANNYQAVSELSTTDMNQLINHNGFMKISDYIPVDAWSDFKPFTLNSFARFLLLIK